ncbi:MAG: cation transporter [Rhodocyclaceae bacterium]|nr:cation transporter [Rhodocyclaceae bacterium]
MHASHRHHQHSHGHHEQRAAGSERRLLLALALTLGFAGIEAAAGWHADSLSLLGDAGHMLTDSLALGIAALAAVLARRPPTPRHSYGLARSKTLAAFANALFMLLLISALLWQSLQRLDTPRPVDADTVTVVALIGLVINVVVATLLAGHGHDLNTRAALLHVIGDLLGSIAALASGVLIKLTGWMPVDALLAMLIAGLIAASTLGLLRSAMHTLMNGVPRDLSLPEVGRRLAGVDGVNGVHDLHIWELDDQRIALSAHVSVRDMGDWPQVLARLQRCAREAFGIEHPTFQPEPVAVQPLTYVPSPPSPDRHGETAVSGGPR